MKVLSFFGIKGGIAKTVSSLAFAQILHEDYSKRVLLIDIDKQASSSKTLSDYKELTRFLEVTKCRSFVLAHHDENSPSDTVIAIYNRFEGRWYDRKYRCVVSLDAELRRHFKRYGTLYLTQKNTNHYLLEVLKSLKQMEVA